MKSTTQMLGAVSALALIAMSSTPALAVGTNAGDTITNNVSVSFKVGDQLQNEVTASDTFTVDRVIDVEVTFKGASPEEVSPGQTQAVLAFDVLNLSNDTVDLDLSTVLTAGTAANIENITIYLDANDDGILQQSEIDAGAITFLDEVAADPGDDSAVISVLVVADITTDAVNTDTFDIVLVANAHEAGAAGLGVEITGLLSTDVNTAGEDTVLADGTSTALDAANQGDDSALGQFEVAGALVSVVKSSRIISDPVNGLVNPKAIPGAVIEYCIAVTNALGAATATAVNVSDDLPADVTFTPNDFGIFVNGTALIDINATPADLTDDIALCAGGTNAEGTANASYTAAGGTGGLNEIAGLLSDIPASTTRSVYFQVTIN